MIFTVFFTDGSKKRFPVGYTGTECHAATAPYEKYDAAPVEKVPTPEAYQVPTTKEVVREKQRI